MTENCCQNNKFDPFTALLAAQKECLDKAFAEHQAEDDRYDTWDAYWKPIEKQSMWFCIVTCAIGLPLWWWAHIVWGSYAYWASILMYNTLNVTQMIRRHRRFKRLRVSLGKCMAILDYHRDLSASFHRNLEQQWEAPHA